MQLHDSTDYALRALLYLAADDRGRYVPPREIADVFGLSPHHVRKLTKDLTARGWLQAKRGAGGGVRLAAGKRKLRVGRVVAALEPIALVECFREDGACRIAAGCRLRHALDRAKRAFLDSLDEHTVDDLVQDVRLRQLLAVGG